MNDFAKLIVFYIGRAFSCFFLVFPIKKNRIMFTSYKGSQYSCNPKAVSEYIKENMDGKYEIVWGLNTPSKYQDLLENEIIVVKHGSIKFYYYLLTAKVLVTNVDYLSYVFFRKKQFIIDTWHGGGSYKRVGSQTKNINKLVNKRREYFNLRTNLFLSSSEAFTKETIRESFNYQGNILEKGMPRNDILINNNEKLILEVKKAIGVDINCKLVLYAPTYRNVFEHTDYLLDINKLIGALERKFGGQWVVLYRLHPMVSCNIKNDAQRLINVSNYDDMQELLLVSDILITDYSSCMWDFSLTKKPCFLFATDLQNYIGERDFYRDIHTWPFVLSENNDELEEQILNFSYNKYLNDVEEHHQELKNFETGNASQYVSELILQVCN